MDTLEYEMSKWLCVYTIKVNCSNIAASQLGRTKLAWYKNVFSADIYFTQKTHRSIISLQCLSTKAQ